MDLQMIEAMKGKTREERLEYFRTHKVALLSNNALKSVNGGATTNPNSENPWDGDYWSSWRYVCNGDRWCGP